MNGRRRRGAVLIAVLLASLAIWLLLAGLLLLTRLRYEAAVAGRDQAVARAFAHLLLERRRTDAVWPIDAADTEGSGEAGACTWRVRLLDHDDDSARFEAQVEHGRAQVTLDATVRRSLAPLPVAAPAPPAPPPAP